MNFIQKIKAAKAFIGLIKDPTKTENVFKIASVMLSNSNKNSTKPIVDYAFSHPEFKSLYEQKYLAPKMDLDALLKSDPNTLGYGFAKFLRENNLDPEFFPPLTTDDPAHYIVLRGRQTHDLFHILTGYTSSVQDEIALQAFTCAQIRSPLAAVLVGMGILHYVVYRPTEIPALMDAISLAYERGKKAKFMLAVPWEKMLNQPLHELRKSVNIAA